MRFARNGVVMKTSLELLAAVSIALASGCAVTRDYTYRPSAASVAEISGQAAAIYALPPERPEGEVRVVSFGIHDLQAAPGGGTFPALHVRLLVTNNGDAVPWALDTSQVLLDVPGEGTVGAMYANTDQGGMPHLAIARGERRTVDFYFPVPGHVASEERLPAFDLRWQVQTGARIVAERTPFQRFELREPVDPYPQVVVAGWGPFWWFHPHYPRAHVFVHPPIVVIPGHAPPHRVKVIARRRGPVGRRW
jgi:hypothetical protein